MAHSTLNIQHFTSIISHPTFHIPHPTLHTPHSQHPSLPAKYLCLSSAPAAQSVLLTSTPHGFCVDLWHLREKYSCAAWHIPNPIFHLPHPTSNISHSTFSTLLPQIYTLFPVAPRPASKYAILSASLQPPNIQPLIFRSPLRQIPNTPFPTTKRHLSTLHLCPFEAPSLTFRLSIPKPPQPDTCPTPAPPSAYGLSTRPHFASEPLKPCLPALCFTQNPDPTFPPNIFNVVWFSSYRLLGVERGMIYQVDSWIDGLGMMQKCNERSTFAVVAQSAAVEQATE